MKSSLTIAGFFAAGLVLGVYAPFPDGFFDQDFSMYALYLLIFLVGVTIGGDPRLQEIIRSVNVRILMVPVFLIAGTLAGASVYILLFNTLPARDTMAVSCGFGYYSLSSVLISDFSGKSAGVIALLANVIREITTLLLAPLMVRYFGKLGPVMAGGATAMDTTMPVILRFSGKEFSIVGLLSGIILTFLMPLIISLIYSI